MQNLSDLEVYSISCNDCCIIKAFLTNAAVQNNLSNKQLLLKAHKSKIWKT